MRARAALVETRGAAWERLEALVERAEGMRGGAGLRPEELSELARSYRALASDLMRARRDRLGADLERHLDGLAARAHNVLYEGVEAGARVSISELLRSFPGAVRRNWAFFSIASVLFYGPLLIAGFAALTSESYALAALGPAQLAGLESMYEKALEGRAGGANASMTGFYVWNNVGIAFRCFATGIFFGLGSIYFLVSNGTFIGAAFGHLVRVELGENLFTFVSAHSPWELTAIVISGAAGLRMGFALIVTGGRTRLGSLASSGPELLRLVAGAAIFLWVAALLEGWVSPSSLSPLGKRAIGLFGWLFVAYVLTRGGRGAPAPAARPGLFASARNTRSPARLGPKPRGSR